MIKIDKFYKTNSEHGNSIYSSFYDSRYDKTVDGEVTRKELIVDLYEGDAESLKVKLEYENLNVGDKINIEVASNGFIVKAKNVTRLCINQYDLESYIKECVVTKDSIEFTPEAGDFDYEDALRNYLDAVEEES